MHQARDESTPRIARLPDGFGFGGFIPRATSTRENIPIGGYVTDNYPENMMYQALVESMKGVGQTIPNPAVGCVLTRNGKIISAGYTESYGGRHAERVAFNNLQQLHEASAGLDAFVTLEPCSHHGRQPPCCELFENSGIRSLYIAIPDPNPLVGGKGLTAVAGNVQNLNVGLAKHAATAWHLPFLVEHRLGRPLVVGKWAQTLDGAFADQSGRSQWITGPLARAYGHWLRQKYDVTVVGLGTLLLDQPSLSVRDCWRPNERQPDVCIIDALGEATCEDARLNSGLSKILQSTASARKVALVTTAENASQLAGKLPESVALLTLSGDTAGTDSLISARRVAQFWTSDAMRTWLDRLPQSIFIEGGATLLSGLLEIDALDLLHVFIAPMVLAGEARRLQRQGHTAPPLNSATHFDVLSTFALGNDMLMELMPRRMSETFFRED
ncbi:MAG: bifunctional diaminohydroxyphosphoribosylaminopyrimidine [Pseudomonadota bacterium]|jgi:diaminohydroxyphosphoribosylaminopyrimidine deaminase/5-amino-6-(5-phosphoribosylamino)uracil reductase